MLTCSTSLFWSRDQVFTLSDWSDRWRSCVALISPSEWPWEASAEFTPVKCCSSCSSHTWMRIRKSKHIAPVHSFGIHGIRVVINSQTADMLQSNLHWTLLLCWTRLKSYKVLTEWFFQHALPLNGQLKKKDNAHDINTKTDTRFIQSVLTYLHANHQCKTCDGIENNKLFLCTVCKTSSSPKQNSGNTVWTLNFEFESSPMTFARL